MYQRNNMMCYVLKYQFNKYEINFNVYSRPTAEFPKQLYSYCRINNRQLKIRLPELDWNFIWKYIIHRFRAGTISSKGLIDTWIIACLPAAVCLW